MPKPVAEVGEGHDDASGNGVYCFIRDLIVEGRDARFVDKRGRYVINWSRALKCYHDYKSKRNPQYKSKNINRRKASNGLRAALLNFYKKEGAKEYNDGKKVNENNEVVERQFQMPPRLFESLFGSDAQLSDDSSEHVTSSITSEADEKPLAAPNSSDTGYDEAMDISHDLFNANEEPNSHCALGGLPVDDPLCSNVKTEEDQVDPSNITSPCQMFDISGEELDLVIGEICSNSDTNDIDLLGVVRDICPSSGSVKGGVQFYISLTEELSEDDKSGIAHFDGIGDVCLEKLNCYTLAGTIPASQQPGTVPVTVSTQDGRLLGMTCFMYVDEIQEVLKQVVKDPALQSLYLTMWSQEYGFFGNDGNLDPFTSQGAGSSIQGTHTQALKGLQLLVYTAAQTNAQQFIQMIFSTSAGRLVFNAYKNRPQLPEDVARANGHDDLAQYLQDVNARLSKENSNNAQPSSIDWLELIEAVNKIQKQSCVVENETDLEIRQSKDDDNESDYFADAETSSCGSFELEFGWSDSEDGEGPCSKGGGSDKEPDVKSAPSMNVMQCKAYTCAEVETQSDNYLEDDKNSEEDEVKEVCGIGCFGQQIGVPTQNRENTSEREPEARACLDQEKCIQWKSPFTKDERPKKEPDARLTPCMEGTSSEAPTVLGTNLDNETDQKAGGKSDRKLVTTEVEKSSLVSQLSKKVAAIGKEEEASTVPSQEKTTKPKRTRKWLKGDAVTPSSQQGACVNETQEVPSFRERSYQGVTGGGTRDRENINDRKEDATTGPSQAKRHKQRTRWRPFKRTLLKSFFLLTITVITVLCLAAGIKLREGQLLHWVVRNGHIRISQALLKFVSDVDAPNFRGETPLHVATKNEYKDLADLLMKLGSNVNSEDYQQQTPLHLAAWSGCQEIANTLIRHGSDVNARDDSQQTALHLAALNGRRNVLQVLIQSGSDVNAEQRLGWTPLHLAALAGHKEIGEVLVQHGSVINIRDNLGFTPLHLASISGHLQMVQFLLQRGSDVKARFGELSALHGAAIFGHKQIVELLIHHGSNVNAWNMLCGTPLHSAVYNFHRNIAEVLIQNGSDVNARGIFGQTPLHLAAMRGDQEITKLLIQQGCERKAQDKSQQTALHLAAQNGHRNVAEVLIRYGSDVNVRDTFRQTPLHLAVWSGDQEIAQFLIQQGSELKAQDNSQQTPLHLAARNGQKNIAEVLLRFGSDVTVRNKYGETPLHLAARSGDQQITEFLLPHGSEPKTQDELQQTYLHLPAQNRSRNVAEVLILYGGDVNLRNKFGETPLHLAVCGGHKQIVQLFLYYESDVNARDGFHQAPIHLAASSLRQQVAEALIRYRCDISARDTFLQTPLHLATRSGHREMAEFLTRLRIMLKAQDYNYTCLASVNLSIGLGDDISRPRDHKLKLDKPSGTQCLSIPLGRGDSITHSINPDLVFKCFNSTGQNLSYQGLRLISMNALSFSSRLATNGKTKDRGGIEAKISHSFAYIDRCIKNGTNKVLIRSESPELPLKEIAYEENLVLNVTVLHVLITLFYIVLGIGVYYLVFLKGTHSGCRERSNSFNGRYCERNKRITKWTILPARSGMLQRRYYPVENGETNGKTEQVTGRVRNFELRRSNKIFWKESTTVTLLDERTQPNPTKMERVYCDENDYYKNDFSLHDTYEEMSKNALLVI